MSRSSRLLELLQILRQYRYPVKGKELADKLGVSLRTLYRDIKTLQGQGATIEGEAGIGYILRSGYLLPPLMFSAQEIEAVVLGMRWVSKKGDDSLKKSAHTALAKVTAVLPVDVQSQVETSPLFIGPGEALEARHIDLSLIRQAIHEQIKVNLIYHDLQGSQSTRTIWPIALAYFEPVRLLVAWCELRQAFRHFRIDRILQFKNTSTPYPKNRQALLKQWRQIEKISAPDF